MRKILFLDIDGVLAIESDQPSCKNNKWTLSSSKLDLFDQLIRNVPNLEVVITSSWRTGDVEKTKTKLAEHGFRHTDKIVGETIRGYQCLIKGVHLPIPRGVEVKAWLDLYVRKTADGFTGEIFKDYIYAIIDDDEDFLMEQDEFFFQCYTKYGLTRTIADRIANLLLMAITN